MIRTATADGKLNTWVSVQFDCKESAEKALQLSGTELMGRPVTVDPATSSGEGGAGVYL